MADLAQSGRGARALQGLRKSEKSNFARNTNNPIRSTNQSTFPVFYFIIIFHFFFVNMTTHDKNYYNVSCCVPQAFFFLKHDILCI